MLYQKSAQKISVCIATGPSLTQEDVDYVRGKAKVYVINDAYKLAPWADVLYACDSDWWDYHNPDFAGQKYTISPQASEKHKLNLLDSCRDSWSDVQGRIATGGNSGFQCLNLAFLHGADKIILLGYDMKTNQKSHFFGDHPQPLLRNSNYSDWIKRFNMAVPFINREVVNCSPDSALDCFPKIKLRDAI